MKVNAKILICYNAPVSIFTVYSGKPGIKNTDIEDLSEVGFSKELDIIRRCLSEFFDDVDYYAVKPDVEQTITDISKIAPDLIFNLVESVEGIASYEYCMAGVFGLLQIPYTGNMPSTLGNCLNKERTKNILRSFNINTPASIILSPGDRLTKTNFSLNFPAIVKLLNEDASIGISEFSVVKDIASLKKQLKFLFATYNQPVIIEEYIDGRELNVAILGKEVLPVSEIKFNNLPDGLPKIVTYEGKWVADSIYYNNTKPKVPALLDIRTKKKVEEIAIAAFDALNCRDYARVDIRLNKNKKPFVIEVNPNPDISTDSGFARTANAAGINYPKLLSTIANLALNRRKNDTQNRAS